MKRIALLSTTHLSRNPRLVKEIAALSGKYQLEVVYFQYMQHFAIYDEEIERKYPQVIFHKLNWLSKFNIQRVVFSVITIALTLIKKVFSFDPLPEQRLFKGYLHLLYKASKIKANLYHGHNPGALAAAVNAARRNYASAGFDAEDYHRGESEHENAVTNLTASLEDKYIPRLGILLTASPLINELYKEHYPGQNPICINNVFPLVKHRDRTIQYSDKLSLVWFSQYVGKDRGIQDILHGINLIDNYTVMLDIYGEVTNATIAYFQSIIDHTKCELNFKGIVSPDTLEKLLPGYDIGICSEDGRTLNRQICLTNKTFSYLQAGTALLMSNTRAQTSFFQNIISVGTLYVLGNPESVKSCLMKWIDDPNLLQQHKQNSYSAAQDTYNWEKESQKLLHAIDRLTTEKRTA